MSGVNYIKLLIFKINFIFKGIDLIIDNLLDEEGDTSIASKLLESR